MLVLSIAGFIDEAIADPDTRNATGNVHDLSVVFGEPALRAFETQHNGVFAFLAFEPGADAAVEQYLREGTMARDSGQSVLVFYTAFAEAHRPTPVERTLLPGGLVIEAADSPAQQMIRQLFSDGAPPLPGLLVFESVVERREALYFDLTGQADAAAVRAVLRRVFTLTTRAGLRRHATDRGFADLLAVSAQRERLAFVRSGPVTARQWLVRAYQLMQQHAGTIAGAIGL